MVRSPQNPPVRHTGINIHMYIHGLTCMVNDIKDNMVIKVYDRKYPKRAVLIHL